MRPAQRCATRKGQRRTVLPPRQQSQQQPRHRQALRKGKAPRNDTTPHEAVAPQCEQHGQPRRQSCDPGGRTHQRQRAEAEQHREHSRDAQIGAKAATPSPGKPEIKRRMHIGLPQHFEDCRRCGCGEECGAHLGHAERRPRPIRPGLASRHECRVALVIFRSAANRRERQHYRPKREYGQEAPVRRHASPSRGRHKDATSI